LTAKLNSVIIGRITDILFINFIQRKYQSIKGSYIYFKERNFRSRSSSIQKYLFAKVYSNQV